MTKKILFSLVVVIVIGFMIIGSTFIKRSRQTLKQDIVFLDTQGYLAVPNHGYGIVSLDYYNVNTFDESRFGSTVTILGDNNQKIEDLNYTITTQNTYNHFTKKRITITFKLEDTESFTLKAIRFGDESSTTFEIGSIDIIKSSRNPEITVQGYEFTISSFSNNIESGSYQAYLFKVENKSNQDIFIERVISHDIKVINQMLERNQKMDFAIDYSDYFSATHVIANSLIEYSYNEQLFVIALEPIYYQEPMTESEITDYILSRQSL